MSGLREQLDYIVNSGSFAIGEHEAEINKLPGHTIRLIKNQTFSEPYNCFSYALDVVESEPINRILKEDAMNRAKYGAKFGTDFINKLVAGGILKKDDGGNIIIYYRDGDPKHAGKILDTRVTSKWGFGLLWEHGVWEIPLSYGDKSERFSRTNIQDIEASFEEYYENLKSLKER